MKIFFAVFCLSVKEKTLCNTKEQTPTALQDRRVE